MVAVPSDGIAGRSYSTAGGSDEDVACCGTSSTRLPQRVRAVMVPSVITVSPFFSEMRWRDQ